MTVHSPLVDFMVGLRKIDKSAHKPRDLMVLWTIAREGGQMGKEIAARLGYPSRSHIQDAFERLMKSGFIEDRRKTFNQQTPNDFWITPAGEAFLIDIIPS